MKEKSALETKTATLTTAPAATPTIEKLQDQIKTCLNLAESLQREILPHLPRFQYYLPPTEEIDEKKFTGFINTLYEEKVSCLDRNNPLFYQQFEHLINQYA